MGLLDGLLNDPEQAATVLGLLRGQPATPLLMGLGQAQAERARRKQQEDMQRLQMEQMQMQIAQQRQRDQREQQEQALAQQFARPGMPERPQMGPTPDGSQMPMSPPQAPGFDYGGYAGALAGVDPMKALALQAQLAGMNQKESFTLKPGEKRYQGDKVIAEGGPEGQKVGTVREVKSGPNTVTYEWDGQKWQKIAVAPTHAPDKPAAPQLYAPDGQPPIWITPPSRGSGSAPVLGPDGQPVAPKKSEKPLTESQAKASVYLGQMKEARAVIDSLAEQGFTGQGVQQIPLQAASAGMGAETITGKVAAGVANMLSPPAAQKYSQAQEQWSEAFLRFKTGAASTKQEVQRNILTFFPQPGDGPEKVAQKSAMRDAAERDMALAAGHGSEQVPEPMSVRQGAKPQGWSIKRKD